MFHKHLVTDSEINLNVILYFGHYYKNNYTCDTEGLVDISISLVVAQHIPLYVILKLILKINNLVLYK